MAVELRWCPKLREFIIKETGLVWTGESIMIGDVETGQCVEVICNGCKWELVDQHKAGE